MIAGRLLSVIGMRRAPRFNHRSSPHLQRSSNKTPQCADEPLRGPVGRWLTRPFHQPPGSAARAGLHPLR